MKNIKKLLLLILAMRPSGQEWYCGDVYIAETDLCMCGNTTLSIKDRVDNKQCCGIIRCELTDTGGVCHGGSVCKSSRQTWPCGDTIMSSNKKCLCGDYAITRDEYWYGGYWCCTVGDVCDYQDGGAQCHNGTLVHGYTACGGSCHERYFFPCKTGDKCVEKYDMCHGAPQCSDYSDIDQCQPGTEIANNDYRYEECGSLPISSHQEFYYTEERNNQAYDCLSRSDEDTIEEFVTTVDYEAIIPCNTTQGWSGLLCGNICVNTQFWCDPVSRGSFSCGGFTTRDRTLCSNTTFWSQQHCNSALRGDIGFLGTRCTANHQHCIYPVMSRWNMDTKETKFKLRCHDKSDQVFPTGCNNKTDTDAEYCRLFCPQGKHTTYRGFFTNKTTGNSVKKGSKCYSACSTDNDTVEGCEDICSTENYNFTCKISGRDHCLHPNLVCDGHPVCDDGSDEKLSPNCIEKLVILKLIDEAATQRCTSVMYSSKYSFAQTKISGPYGPPEILAPAGGFPTSLQLLHALLALIRNQDRMNE